MKTQTKPEEVQPKVLTLELLQKESYGNVGDAVQFAKTFYAPYPERVPKPYLKNGASSTEAKQYAILLEEWENKDMQYKKEKEIYNEVLGQVNDIIEKYIKDLAGFDNLPENAKSKVWSKAYSDGHSEGFESIYNHLVELVGLFD